jgi:hypothetical protein
VPVNGENQDAGRKNHDPERHYAQEDQRGKHWPIDSKIIVTPVSDTEPRRSSAIPLLPTNSVLATSESTGKRLGYLPQCKEP